MATKKTKKKARAERKAKVKQVEAKATTSNNQLEHDIRARQKAYIESGGKSQFPYRSESSGAGKAFLDILSAAKKKEQVDKVIGRNAPAPRYHKVLAGLKSEEAGAHVQVKDGCLTLVK